MNVSLREIDRYNYRECISLKVAGGQEKFVAPNVFSIAQSKIYPNLNPFTIYTGDEMVGFVMYGYNEDDGRFWLDRLMIAEKHQGKGYGRAATLEVIERLSQIEDCREIYLSFVPENTGAEKLYSSIGFARTGELEQGEIVMRLEIKNNANRKSQI
ncbi:MAG: GNAT family N-acetyltransferase [Pyrinomonadaceae bacterium]